MVSMLDVDNMCVLACHPICIYSVCVTLTHSLSFSFLPSAICISFDT